MTRAFTATEGRRPMEQHLEIYTTLNRTRSFTTMDELATAAATGDTERVRSLLLGGLDVNGVNCFGRTPLQVMMMGSTPVAQLLLQRGADPNLSDQHTGTTPLHDAARLGFLDTAEMLVHFLADPNARDNRDCRPIDLAREYGHMDVVSFFENL